MLIDKDQDLGLSLGLSSSEAGCSLRLNLMPSSSPPPTALCLTQSEQRTVLASQGIDVNRAPMAEIDIEEDAGASSPNSTVSTENCGGKRRYYAGGGEEIDGDRACSRGVSDEEDGDGSRKKLRLSKDQAAILEESFKENNTLNPKQKLALANKLNLRPRQVEVWFQNRRARTKLKQTEVDCEFLKLCCENLTEENRRLQKEVQELRSLKLSPPFFMHMTPPTTLTMCPSCERIAVSNSTAPPPPPPAKLPRSDMHQLFPRPLRPPVAAMPGWAPIVLRSSFLNATAKPQRS
ncbi:hypothetical protein KFK09_018943 [Dendrobium nobile]|uniref:Homeobox domain-containing protein n=1 Tax=Dendrobium nobile TaxID=94219 RepID=A0A8T3AX78_DENNO|nr:hypothetical protein KFK09_018943 [Dendrobium nobile]